MGWPVGWDADIIRDSVRWGIRISCTMKGVELLAGVKGEGCK
jgi:hypothetical protein